MQIIQIVSMIATMLLLLGTYFILRFKGVKLNSKVFKATSLVLAAVFLFRFMLGRDSLDSILALGNSPIPNTALTAVSLILNWAMYSVVLLLILYPFFADSKYAFVIKYYGLIVGIVSAVFVDTLTLGVVGADAYTGFNVRTLLMGIEFGMVIAYCAVVFAENDCFKIKAKDLWGLVYIVGMLLATMPGYMIRALFGESKYVFSVTKFAPYHRIILYISVILPVALYFLLRKKDKEAIRGILLYISLGTLLSFSINNKFMDFTNVTDWPIHLCNTAMYIIPLCLIFKWEKLFYFTYFINVLGAFLAMAMPNYDAASNIFSFRVVNFYINHYIAFFMPLLIVALRVYERPKLKQFKYSMVGFGIYFVLVLIFNAWFSNYGEVDFFFTNSDFIAEKLGTWAQNLFKGTWAFNIGDLEFVFHPLYQVLFFLVYVLLGLAMWFVYEQGYAFADMMGDIVSRNRKIKMDKLALEISKIERSRSQMAQDAKTKLELINFSKKYGTSKSYAVKDANLEINGGEIFGFLGHNGAGKSTIIKSIVGIQPITSGTIKVCGFDVDKEPVMAKRNIGFVPDHYALYEKLTGREYINYIADLYDVSKEDRTKSIDKYTKLFELETAIDNPIKTYSHGMKQKITIMSALVHNPKLWILDEPLTGLDPNSIFQVKECMRQHAKEGNIVFFSSHIIDVVETICDRIAIIKKGDILTVKTMKEIEEDCGLEQFYLKTIDPEGYKKLEKKIEKKLEKIDQDVSKIEKLETEMVQKQKNEIEDKLNDPEKPVKKSKKAKGDK
ncbi:MAG: YwaF family protein [Clostridia bacterium]|nr:YwaF family protein [Clostridia bacterium]